MSTTEPDRGFRLPQPTRDLAQLRRDLDVAGYCLVADALSPAQVDAVLGRVLEQAAAEERARGDRPDRAYRAVESLLDKGGVFHDLLLHERVNALLEHLLGEDFLLSLFDARGLGPGHGAQALHSDQVIVPCRTPVPFIANALWMLVDFTAQNGATRVLPGSHRWGEDHPVIQRDMATWSVFSPMMNALHDDARDGAAQLRRGARGMNDANPPGTVAAEAPAGTVLVFDGQLIHGAGLNTTADIMRWTVLAYYCRPFMRQLTNPFLSLSDDAVRALPAALRRRIGYRPWTLVGRYQDSMSWARPDHVPGAATRGR